MDAPSHLQSLRAAGTALLATCILFMVGAGVAAYFRRFPLPSDPLEQLTLIANDRAGWSAQAIIFPICFVAVAVPRKSWPTCPVCPSSTSERSNVAGAIRP